jgi:hypothetical protein
MGSILARGSIGGAESCAPRRFRVSRIALVAGLALICGGCSRLKPVDTSSLETSGMSYNAVQQLTALHLSVAEVAEIAQARQGGFSDDDCVEILKIYRNRNHPFDAGDAVAGLVQVGMSDSEILDLARMGQLGLGWGELQAMKLAGIGDAVIMEVARRHEAGKPVLSGASLARLKNVGVREPTLLELVRRGVPDSKASAIIAYRRHGASETEILRRFGGS